MHSLGHVASLVLGLAVLTAGCSSRGETPDPTQPAEGAEHIECAVGGQTEFRPVCAVDRKTVGDVLTLIVRHPDGGFRRFEVLKDGRGVAVADGAHPGVTTYSDSFAEIAVDKDRYRFPVSKAAGNSSGEGSKGHDAAR